MLNCADLPSIEGVEMFCVSAEVGVPLPAAQSCPARCELGGKSAPQDCQPDMA